ncbi:alpha-amylase family glycosyl hydrolase [Bacteroidota bacterium]
MKLSELESSVVKIEISIRANSYTKGNSGKYEFHIAKEIRKKYEFDDVLFSISGNVILADFYAVRRFTQKINSKRKASDHVRAGEVNGAGLIDEIYHFLLNSYESELNPGVFKRAVEHVNQSIGEKDLYKLLSEFVMIFPPLDVYKQKITIPDYLASFTGTKSNFEIVVEELLLLYFANINKANTNIIELFDENYFQDKSNYNKFVDKLDKFFRKEIKFGPFNQDIFTFFKAPILNHPEDIEAQLDFILDHWGVILKDEFRRRILSGKDLIREDRIIDITGNAQSAVPVYKGENDADSLSLGKSGYKYGIHSRSDYDEHERFTSDTDWMPRVVIMAKNVYVWLDQLSKKYQRHIHRLDQIPDEELDQLAHWNFTGLWLIGIWERSSASKKIKHIMGNIDAVASAYSLYDYQIAHDIGGEEAYNNFNERARARGIRLASDMVPNHTGIFSRWVRENPDYFVQLDYPPFPNYRFTGEDLSEDPNIQLRIEDGYWERRDAAVTFQRIDNQTGELRYIYHGNDGTNMPWNDTAQLDMLKAEVREAVIQKIFEVARRFSIIRFDAAMTLTKKHFSRLWYPQPGTGGDIPTRSDFALTKEEFDELFPNEFWREVVDRINEEMPDTLLLAEAFWLMEGYFVRTLGMHRVYNSAFMHMMMKEENEKYRDLITNTLEFEPEILKRYVNFMSNPDEETAVNQFGMDDKYFGVAVMMVTLPGLPMFAHGQIEGYTEKYGMEYKRAYYNESPNQWLVERHECEIFPLVQKRYLFSQVQNFWFKFECVGY